MILEIQPVKFEKKRSAAVMDDGEVVLIFNATVKEYGLKNGDNLTSAEVRQIAAEGERHLAFTTAVDTISRTFKSQNEIRDSLKQKKFSKDAIDATVEKLLGYKYIGDEQYVEAFLNFKGDKYGRRKIIYELTTMKGIPKPLAESAVYDRLDDDTEIEKATALAGKYVEKERKKRGKLKDKTYNFLAVRGFDNEIIRAAVGKLDFSDTDDEL